MFDYFDPLFLKFKLFWTRARHNNETQQRDTTIYLIQDIQPEFKYEKCLNTPEACKKYFMDNFKMPKVLEDNSYHGNIIVTFIVEKDSSISHISLTRGMGDALDKCVLETVKTMRKWTPGCVNGKTVRSRFTLPISVHWLYGNEEEKTQ
jgi:protein TonB